MDPGAKVTYNGVQIGRVGKVQADRPSAINRGAKLILDVDPKYIKLIPANVDADISATTVFGNKYVSLHVAERPDTATHHASRCDRRDVGDHRVQHVVRDHHVDVAEQVDPVKLNQTLVRDREALDRPRRSVRPVDRQRQRDPGRHQPADAADPPRHPAAGRSGRRVRQRGARSVRRSGERGHHRAHAQRAAEAISIRR